MSGGASGRWALPLRGAAERVHRRASGRRRRAGDRLPWAFPTSVVRVAPATEEIPCAFLPPPGALQSTVSPLATHRLQRRPRVLADGLELTPERLPLVLPLGLIVQRRKTRRYPPIE